MRALAIGGEEDCEMVGIHTGWMGGKKEGE